MGDVSAGFNSINHQHCQYCTNSIFFVFNIEVEYLELCFPDVFTADISLTLSKKKNKAPSTVSTAIDSIGNVIVLAGNHTQIKTCWLNYIENHTNTNHTNTNHHTNRNMLVKLHREWLNGRLYWERHSAAQTFISHMLIYNKHISYHCLSYKKIINVISADPEFYPASLWCPQEDYLIWGQVNIVFVVFSECRHCLRCFWCIFLMFSGGLW